jgi:hypothetical protein
MIFYDFWLIIAKRLRLSGGKSLLHWIGEAVARLCPLGIARNDYTLE